MSTTTSLLPPGTAVDGVDVVTAEEALGRTEGTAIVVLPTWTPAVAATLSDHAWNTDLRLVPVRCDGSTVVVGPVLHRGAAVCMECVEVARLATLGGRTPRAHADLQLGGAVPPALLPLVQALAADALAAAQAPDLDRHSRRRPADRHQHHGTAAKVTAVRTHDGTVATHHVRTRGEGCPLCGPLPDDTPALAVHRPGSRRIDTSTLRAPNPKAAVERLRSVLHDWRFGPVAHVSRGERVTPAIAAAEVVADWVTRDAGYGRATTYRDAERIALFEAVERLTGMNPRGRRTVTRASFADLGPDRAIDVRTLGEHEPHHLRHPRFLLTPYSPELETTWVHGWSFARCAPVAVPEHAVYWGGAGTRSSELAARRGVAHFVAESSNGCGLGGSLDEAMLYALFEVAERDAFLMAWYSRSRLRHVAAVDGDAFTAHQIDRLDTLGYDLLLFDITNDLAVPAVMSLAVCRDTRSPAPQAFFAAGAHLDPRRAIASAVAETTVNVVQSAGVAENRPAYFDRNRLRPMLTRPDLVAGLDDHVGLGTLPETRPRYRHLLDAAAQQPPEPWTEVWPEHARVVGTPTQVDLAQVLRRTTDRFLAAGVDVVVVDQTDPAIADELGLHAAKVLAPGALPMTFGEVYRRTRGLSRLLDVPHRLGRVDTRPRYEDLPFDPHPFP